MPIHEFYCNICNKTFEFLIIKNNDQLFCPYCKNIKINRLMSSFSHKSDKKKLITSHNNNCTSCSKGTCSSCH